MDYFYFTLVLAMLVVIAIVAAEFYYIKCRKDATEKWYSIETQLYDLRARVEATNIRLSLIQDSVSVQTFDLLYHMDRQERDVIFRNNRDLENWYEGHFNMDNENDDKEM
jgi:hypothetical protein